MTELNEFETNLIEKIEEYGWFALSVAPSADSDDPQEWWTYTIGLPHSRGWPEFVCFGLDSNIAHSLLKNAIDECLNKEQVPSAGMILTEVFESVSAKLVDGSYIPDEYFGTARWFARHVGTKDPPERLQLLWPDKYGVFPDEIGCVAAVVADQTPRETI